MDAGTAKKPKKILNAGLGEYGFEIEVDDPGYVHGAENPPRGCYLALETDTALNPAALARFRFDLVGDVGGIPVRIPMRASEAGAYGGHPFYRLRLVPIDGHEGPAAKSFEAVRRLAAASGVRWFQVFSNIELYKAGKPDKRKRIRNDAHEPGIRLAAPTTEIGRLLGIADAPEEIDVPIPLDEPAAQAAG